MTIMRFSAQVILSAVTVVLCWGHDEVGVVIASG